MAASAHASSMKSISMQSTTVKRVVEYTAVTTVEAGTFSSSPGAVSLKAGCIDRFTAMIHRNSVMRSSPPHSHVRSACRTELMVGVAVKEKRSSEDAPRRIESPPK